MIKDNRFVEIDNLIINIDNIVYIDEKSLINNGLPRIIFSDKREVVIRNNDLAILKRAMHNRYQSDTCSFCGKKYIGIECPFCGGN